MQPTRSIPLVLLAALLAVGCQPRPGTGGSADQEPGAGATGPQNSRPAAADADAGMDVMPPDAPLGAESDPGFDMRGFAGTFTGTLPCASCPGIDTTLVLLPDGRYRLAEVYLEQADGRFESEGSWSPEDDGTRILLDPSGKELEDRSYAIADGGTLRLQAPDGLPVESRLDYHLRRTADTPTR